MFGFALVPILDLYHTLLEQPRGQKHLVGFIFLAFEQNFFHNSTIVYPKPFIVNGFLVGKT